MANALEALAAGVVAHAPVRRHRLSIGAPPNARQFRGARLPPHDRSQLAGQPGGLARKPVAACGIHAKAAHSQGQSMSPSARARVTASARL
jgi:hypothetical protein